MKNMAEVRGKNQNLIESGNPRLLKKEVKGGSEYSLYLEYQMGYNHENGTSIRKLWQRRYALNVLRSSWRTGRDID